MKISVRTSVNWQFPLCSNGSIQYVSMSPYLQILSTLPIGYGISNGAIQFLLSFVFLLLLTYRSLLEHVLRRFKETQRIGGSCIGLKTTNKISKQGLFLAKILTFTPSRKFVHSFLSFNLALAQLWIVDFSTQISNPIL